MGTYKPGNERVLIITLGSGDPFDKDQRDELKKCEPEERKEKRREFLELNLNNNKFSYRKTSYQMPGQDEPGPETEYVAGVLADADKPDHVFIIGTVKSAWTGFYYKYTPEQQRKLEDLSRLNDIETDCGSTCGGEELESIQARINAVFQKSIDKKLFPDIKVILIRYGIDDRQLEENYEILNNIWKELGREKAYDISMDITHMFRSIPLFNIVLMNFNRQIGRYRFRLVHIYYGNLEVAGELRNARVVDLASLVSVLDMTNAVSEFRNTGSAKTLIRLFEEADGIKSEEELCSLLRNFDRDLELNDINKLTKDVDALYREVRETKTSFIYTNIREMLKEVLEEKFIQNGDVSILEDLEIHPERQGELQYRLCKWFQEQGRYGQAAALASEVLRSFIVLPYLKMRNINLTADSFNEENNRKNAQNSLMMSDQRRKDLLDHFPDYREEICFMMELEGKRSEVKVIRDCFAHALNSEFQSRKTLSFPANPIEVIDQFIDLLSQLRDKCRSTDTDFYKTFEKTILWHSSDSRKNGAGTDKSVRVVFSLTEGKEEETLIAGLTQQKSVKGMKAYSIVCISSKLKELLSEDQKKPSDDLYCHVFMICRTLIRFLSGDPDFDRIQIIFDDTMGFIVRMPIVDMLKRFGFKHFLEISTDKKYLEPLKSKSWNTHILIPEDIKDNIYKNEVNEETSEPENDMFGNAYFWFGNDRINNIVH